MTAYGIGQGTGTTSSATYTIPVTTSTNAGDAIVVGASINSKSAEPTQVTDTQGNIYTLIPGTQDETEYGSALFISLNTSPLASGTDSFTVTNSSASAGGKWGGAVGIPGVLASSALDVSTFTSGTGSAAPALATGTLAAAPEAVVAFLMSGSGGGYPSWSSPFTALEFGEQASNQLNSIAVGIAPTTAGLTPTGTLSASERYQFALLTLKLQAPTVTTTSLPNGAVGTPYNQTLAATGGTGPYSWSLSSGSLPSPLNLSAAGVISGTPSATGTSSFTVKVTDANGSTATQPLSITVAGGGTLTITTTSPLPSGSVGVPYSQTISATGGTAPYTWSRSAGSVPPGLNFSSAGVLSGTPTTASTHSFTAKVTDSASNTATMPFSITIGAPNPATIVNQWAVTDTEGYAPDPIAVDNNQGNALVAIIAVGSDNESGLVPRTNVSDDVHNWWELAASQTTSLPGAARRLDVWVCANANAANFISVTTSLIYAGVSGFIAEVSGVPTFIDIDFAGIATGSGSGTSTTCGGTATTTDMVMSALALFGSNAAQTATYPAAMTTTFTSVATSSSATDMSDVQLFAAYDSVLVPPGVVSAAWSWTNNADFLAVALGFSATPPPPSQPNPQAPAFITEAAFGFPPADTSGLNPTWTDLSSRVIDDVGGMTIHSTRGRDYELTQPEAGELDILFNNDDGALNPTNISSPWYGQVLPEVPVRSSFFWNGRRYGVGFSYANSWQQTFPYRQWGFVPFSGKDALGIIAQGSMPSAYGGEVLADLASTYYPLGEYYESPHGAQFGNASRFNQRPMIGWSPSDLPADYVLATGQVLGMLGDPASGIGVSTIQSTDSGAGAMGGAFVYDNSLPQFYPNAGSVSYEFWTTGVTAGLTSGVAPLLSGYGKVPWNYFAGTDVVPGEVFGVYAAPAVAGGVVWTLIVGSRAVYTSGSPGSPTTVTLQKSGGGSGTWTCPPGVTTALVECLGGGSGGNGGGGSKGAQGGGGGAYAASTLSLTPGTGYPWSNGHGGPGGGAGDHGQTAGDSSFNNGAVYAQGGQVASNGSITGGQASESTGSTVYSGGKGGTAGGTGGGGGGAPADKNGAGPNGQSVTGSTGGNGGKSTTGSGGHGGNSGQAATGGGSWGGPGGGGGKNARGGDGSRGWVKITYTPTVSATGSVVATAYGSATESALYHVVVTVQPSGGDYIFTLYVNGSVVASATIPAPSNMLVNTIAVGGAPGQGNSGAANNYTVGQVAVYPTALSPQRIQAHYTTGTYAMQSQSGDQTSDRVSGLFQWSGMGVAYGIAAVDSMAPSAIGDADQIQGSALADALYALAVEEGGMYYCPATANGEVWYTPRLMIYNQLPVATFGDDPTDVNNDNPNFEGLAGWTLTSMTGTDADDATVPGGHSATFTVPANATQPSQAYARYLSPVDPTKNYTLYGYLQDLTGGTEQYHIALDWRTANGTYISTTSTSFVTLPEGSWTLLELSVPSASIPSNAALVGFGPAIGYNSIPVTGAQFKAGQFWLDCTDAEIPYDAGSGFDYSDTYLYNIVSSQRTVSTGTSYYIDPVSKQATQQQWSSLGANATAADLVSESEFFPRGPLTQPVETVSDQDAYDRANWTLYKYSQPQLRANQISVDLASNPGLIDQVMNLEQGDVVTVVRRVIGAATISLNCMIQKIEVQAGPGLLTVIFTLSPYNPENAVLQLDGGTNATLGNTALPW